MQKKFLQSCAAGAFIILCAAFDVNNTANAEWMCCEDCSGQYDNEAKKCGPSSYCVMAAAHELCKKFCGSKSLSFKSQYAVSPNNESWKSACGQSGTGLACDCG